MLYFLRKSIEILYETTLKKSIEILYETIYKNNWSLNTKAKKNV